VQGLADASKATVWLPMAAVENVGVGAAEAEAAPAKSMARDAAAAAIERFMEVSPSRGLSMACPQAMDCIDSERGAP
jgi:peroxiredoxin family protein